MLNKRFLNVSDIFRSTTYRIHRRLPRSHHVTVSQILNGRIFVKVYFLLIRICKLLVLSLLITGEREQYGRKGKHPFLKI
ncbi:hypothetical protein T11_2983 [Trichinella zimbabwensis]|uniref:Uncharacterized protein n=1 Tax=Trichinella zimbabwensis TaxID=268475 RepID=A0A0V1HBE8_9BILA|nr:hypothetical protein T11_2983 [Trichinella zimbabwensis]